MKLLKQVAAIAAVTGATFVATTAIIGAFETTEKMVKDGKKHKKLQPDDVEHLLTHKVYDINHVYDQVKALFKHYSPTEEESSVLKTLSPWRFESLSDEYEEITFETSYPDKGKKKAYYKVFLLPSENENVTDVILRLHIDDWDGYMDLVVCRGVAKNINSELFFEVLETCPFLMDDPVQDDFIVFERFIDKATKKIIVKNKVSGAKFLAGNLVIIGNKPMLNYLLNLLSLLKQNNSYNIVKNFKGAQIKTHFIKRLVNVIDVKKSTDSNGLYRQPLSDNLVVIWTIDSGIKKVKEIITNKYQLVIGLKNIILKHFNSKIKDIRFDVETGVISKINFKKHYFINSVDYQTGKASLGLDGINIKEVFNKSKISELSYDEWQVLEVSSKI